MFIDIAKLIYPESLTSSSTEYSISKEEVECSSFTMLLIMFFSMLLSVLLITVIFLVVKLRSCKEEDEEMKLGIDDNEDDIEYQDDGYSDEITDEKLI